MVKYQKVRSDATNSRGEEEIRGSGSDHNYARYARKAEKERPRLTTAPRRQERDGFKSGKYCHGDTASICLRQEASSLE